MIVKFSDFLDESLHNAISTEPEGETKKEAKKLGLIYTGFNRYTDKSGSIQYVVRRDKLVPVSSPASAKKTIKEATDTKKKPAVKKKAEPKKKPAAKKQASKAPTKTAQTPEQKAKEEEQAQKDSLAKSNQLDKTMGSASDEYLDSNVQQIIQTNDELIQLYDPAIFSDDEINAILAYQNGAADSINRYLYKGFDDGTDQDTADSVVQIIDSLDDAFEEAGAPMDYVVYTALSARYTPNKITPGSQYCFRGYVSASLDHNAIIDLFKFSEAPVDVLLEIDLIAGQKSLYIEGFNPNPEGDFEVLLPRGTTIQIDAGPSMVDPSFLDPTYSNSGKQIALFKCSIVE